MHEEEYYFKFLNGDLDIIKIHKEPDALYIWE